MYQDSTPSFELAVLCNDGCCPASQCFITRTKHGLILALCCGISVVQETVSGRISIHCKQSQESGLLVLVGGNSTDSQHAVLLISTTSAILASGQESRNSIQVASRVHSALPTCNQGCDQESLVVLISRSKTKQVALINEPLGDLVNLFSLAGRLPLPGVRRWRCIVVLHADIV